MSRQFSSATVLRMVPNSLLALFFDRLELGDLDIDWEKLGQREITQALKAISLLGRPEQDAVEGALRSVFDLACDAGIDAIFEAAAKTGDLDLPRQMPSDCGPYAKAMWTWLNAPQAFEIAALIHQVEMLTWWRRRCDLPLREPDTSPEALATLASLISDLLLLEQGRGQRCTVEHFRRGDGTDYFYAYPDDFIQNVLAHDSHGVLVPRTFRPTFSIVFAFLPQDGALELCARVPARLKVKLESLFARAVLGTDLGDWQPPAAYELNHLKYRSFRLATDPEDRLCVYNVDIESA